jgi:hypothetical protein
MSSYSFDTSSLLFAYKEHYPIDIFSSVWDFFKKKVFESSSVISCIEVLRELEKKDIATYKFFSVKEMRSKFFVSFDSSSVQEKLRIILKEFPNMTKESKFRTYADPFVVALAFTNSMTVVTEEKRANNKDKIHKEAKIPDVCDFFKIPCFGFVDFLRTEKYIT